MNLILRFPLADVHTIVEHADATEHVSRDYGAPEVPALLLIVDEGIYLRTNAVPPLPRAPEQPYGCWARAVYAEGHSPRDPLLDWMIATGTHDGLLTYLPLRTHGRPSLLDTLRTLVKRGFDTLTIDPRPNPMAVAVTRRC